MLDYKRIIVHMRGTVYSPTHRSADLDLLRERLRSRDRCRLRSLPGDPLRSRSLERERLRLRDSRSFPMLSRSFFSEESPAICRGEERRGKPGLVMSSDACLKDKFDRRLQRN